MNRTLFASRNRFVASALTLSVFFVFADVALAATPNPGHPWTEVGDGTFQVSGPTALRTYIFPDANATVLTASGTGTSSQYYRGDGTFQTLNTAAVPESTNLYYTQGRFDAALGAKSTSDITEGSNLYYTTSREHADFDARLATKTTGDLTEGSNLYYTQGRFDTAFGAKTTSDLAEGSNQYFTPSRARGAISATAPALYDNTTGIISISAASTSTDGYLSSADWNSFNMKVDGTRTINATGPLSGGGDLSADRTISISQASGSTDGYLSSVDWSAFNGKENGLAFSGPLSRSGDAISIPLADSGTDGYLQAADWATFNNKEDPIASGTTDQYFRGDKTWQTLNSDVVPEGVTNLYYTDAAVDSRIALQAGAPGGLAQLDGSGKVLTSQLPALSITDTFVVADEPSMLALAAETGDVAVRTDENQSYILAGPDPMNSADWQGLLTPTDTVQSVNGQTGSVSLTTDAIPEGSKLYYTDDLARGAISASAPVHYDDTTGVISMAAADTTTDGYLSSADWNIFNAKENPLTFSGPLGRIGDVISIPAATGSADGYLSFADWTTFNGKLSTALTSAHLFVGNGSNVATDVALSGDATLANTGALAIANNAVTLPKLANIATGTLLGRNTASTGNVEVLTAIPNDVQDTITRLGTITIGVWNGTSIGTAYTDAKVKTVAGTTNRISTGGTATDPTVDIASTYVGQTSITTLGTIATGTWNGTAVDLAHGGTNANLTASNGGIAYSTNSALAILGGTSTAGQILRSGSNAAPTWSTATYPATTTGNQLLYSTANNVVGGLASGNNGVLVTDSSGVPSISSTIPTASQDNITRLGTITNGVWHGTTVDDAYLTTPYIKADGTRALSADWNVGAFALTAKDFVVSGTAGAGYVNLPAQSSNAPAPSAAGLNIFAGTAGNLTWSTRNGADTFTRAFTGALTANRNWALPDVGGTFMLRDGGQTVTAATWNGTPISEAYGGTNQSTYAKGDILLATAANTLGVLAGDASGLKKTLTMTSQIPSWSLPSTVNINATAQFTSATTGADELAQSMKIPGGTLSAGDVMTIYALFSGTSSANNKLTKLWINGSNTLSGATQISATQTFTTGGQSIGIRRTLAVRSATSIIGSGSGTAGGGQNDVTAGTTVPTAITIPTLANDTYILVSVQRANSGDTLTCELAMINLFKN